MNAKDKKPYIFNSIYCPNWMTKEDINELCRGGRVTVGNKVYMVCHNCRRAININGFFGDIHYCKG